MAKKISVKLILELRGNGMGRNAIARTGHISVNSVGDVFHKADENGISYEDVRDMDEARFTACSILTSSCRNPCMPSPITDMCIRN